MAKAMTSYEGVVKAFAALAHPLRLRILEVLAKSCRPEKGKTCSCVCEINEQIDLPQPYISKHLKVLCEAGILESRREGNRVYYRFIFAGAAKELSEVLSRFHSCCQG